MEHPNIRQRKNQAKLLAQMPEEQRVEQARMFRFGNALYIYHRQAEQLEPSEDDFEEWLDGLPENIREDMEIQGFELCSGVLSFQRYVMEKNGIGMGEWMKEKLSDEDYKAYRTAIQEKEGQISMDTKNQPIITIEDQETLNLLDELLGFKQLAVSEREVSQVEIIRESLELLADKLGIKLNHPKKHN